MTHEVSGKRLSENAARSPFTFLSGKRLTLIMLAGLVLGGLAFFNLRTGARPERAEQTAGQGRQGPQVTPVTVTTVTQKTMPVQIQAIGTVQAERTVSVTPQIGGQITGVYFHKGQEVSQGQLLFMLDDRTALAAIQQAQGTLARDQAQVQQARANLARDLTLVRQAEATLAKDEAQARYAQSQDRRYSQLYQQGAVSQDQAQQYTANNQAYAATLQADRDAIANTQATVRGDQAAIATAEGLVSADQGALQSVQVQLSYTKIYTPIDGRAGDILVNQGNVVQANSTNPLVRIDQIHPIQVSFAVPESNLPTIRNYASNNRLPVTVTFPNSNTSPIRGTLNFVNNAVDNTTGTIQLMGQFDNTQGTLWPGQYVNTTLTLTTQPNATVVPSQAVQNGSNGQFVFLVKPDMTVENVPVTVSSTVNGLAVIQKGLKPGDRVVLDGQANLVAGSKIRIKSPGQGSTGGNAAGSGPPAADQGNGAAGNGPANNSPANNAPGGNRRSRGGGS